MQMVADLRVKLLLQPAKIVLVDQNVLLLKNQTDYLTSKLLNKLRKLRNNFISEGLLHKALTMELTLLSNSSN